MANLSRRLQFGGEIPAAPAQGWLPLELLSSGFLHDGHKRITVFRPGSTVPCRLDRPAVRGFGTRGHLRLDRDDIRWLRSARLKYGPDMRVLDISGPTSSVLVPSKVLRCRVAAFAAAMHYKGACVFKRTPEIPN